MTLPIQALSEIDGMLKYLDKAENEINTADPVSVDPDTLAVQLKDHTVSSPFPSPRFSSQAACSCLPVCRAARC